MQALPEKGDGRLNMKKSRKQPLFPSKDWLNGKRRGSITLESALILPVCMFVVLLILRLGILIYDTYTLSITAQEWADSCLTAGNSDWGSGLAAELKRRMIYPQPAEIIMEETGNGRVIMPYMPLRTITVEIRARGNSKEKLYHFLNGRQLADRIPAVQQMSRKYFDIIRKLKKE